MHPLPSTLQLQWANPELFAEARGGSSGFGFQCRGGPEVCLKCSYARTDPAEFGSCICHVRAGDVHDQLCKPPATAMNVNCSRRGARLPFFLLRRNASPVASSMQTGADPTPRKSRSIRSKVPKSQSALAAAPTVAISPKLAIRAVKSPLATQSEECMVMHGSLSFCLPSGCRCLPGLRHAEGRRFGFPACAKRSVVHGLAAGVRREGPAELLKKLHHLSGIPQFTQGHACFWGTPNSTTTILRYRPIQGRTRQIPCGVLCDQLLFH